MRVLLTGREFGDDDVEREILEAAGFEVVGSDALAPSQVIGAARGAQALLVQYAVIDAAVLRALPELRIVSRYGVGVDTVDIVEAKRRGVLVSNVPVYGGDEVAQHAAGLILGTLRHITPLDRAVRMGTWHYGSTGSLTAASELTLGVLGLGRIGRVVAQRVGPWFGRVLACDPYLDPAADAEVGVSMVDLEDLFDRSDIVSVHVPLTTETDGLIDRVLVRRLGRNGYLVNTARGGIVRVEDLLAALDADELAGAALDVLPTEPPAADDPILRHPKVVLTPHVSWYSRSSEADLRRRTAQNVVDWHAGTPTNLVNRP